MSYYERGEWAIYLGNQLVDIREAGDRGSDATGSFRCDLYREMYEQGFTHEEVNIVWVPLARTPE